MQPITLLSGLVASIALVASGASAQLVPKDAFGNTYNAGNESGSGGWANTPCVPGQIITLSIESSHYLGACHGCVASSASSDFNYAAKDYYSDVGVLQKWKVIDLGSVRSGAIGFQNNATGLLLSRCATSSCKKTSNANPAITPVIATRSTHDDNATWSCVNIRTDTDSTSYSGFNWIISGGKGLYLGRSNTPILPVNPAVKTRQDFGLFSYVSAVQNQAINIASGTIVFKDITVVYDQFA